MAAMPVILDWVAPLNESRPLPTIYFTDYKILDENKYYYLIFMHGYICTVCIILVLINTEMLFIICIQHACAILAAIGYIYILNMHFYSID